ncbi:MAG: hypothetical protein ABEH61_02975 [Haloarculaceae archaeon]
MSHTCDVCGETFDTLSRLRLHDCPGPDLTDSEWISSLATELEAGPERGDVVSSLPEGGIPPDAIDRVRDNDRFETVLVPMNNPGEPTTERLVVLVEDHCCVLEYFPWEGWVVVREATTAGMTEEEAFEALHEQLQDWQSRVAELSMEYASGDDSVQRRLRDELNL